MTLEDKVRLAFTPTSPEEHARRREEADRISEALDLLLVRVPAVPPVTKRGMILGLLLGLVEAAVIIALCVHFS